MKTTPAVLLFASASILLSPLPAHAVATTTKAITCSSTVKLQAAIDAVPAGTFATFNVSGVCNENIVVPQGKSVAIVGVTATSKITAPNVLLPAVTVLGDATLQKMILANATGAADSLVETDKGGVLKIVSSDLSAPSVESVIGAWSGEIRVTNSRVVGGWGGGISAFGATTLIVEGNPASPAGPTGSFETYVKSSGGAIVCDQGGNVRVVVKSKSTQNGIVTLEQSQAGISADLCGVRVLNRTTNRALLRIRNNQVGVSLKQGSAIIENATIANNTGPDAIYLAQADLMLSRSSVTGNQLGVNAQQSNVRIDASTLSNVAGDVRSSISSEIHISSWNGASSFPKALTWTKSFDCWKGSRIDIDAGGLTAALGSKYDFLGCVFAD